MNLPIIRSSRRSIWSIPPVFRSACPASSGSRSYVGSISVVDVITASRQYMNLPIIRSSRRSIWPKPPVLSSTSPITISSWPDIDSISTIYVINGGSAASIPSGINPDIIIGSGDSIGSIPPEFYSTGPAFPRTWSVVGSVFIVCIGTSPIYKGKDSLVIEGKRNSIRSLPPEFIIRGIPCSIGSGLSISPISVVNDPHGPMPIIGLISQCCQRGLLDPGSSLWLSKPTKEHITCLI